MGVRSAQLTEKATPAELAKTINRLTRDVEDLQNRLKAQIVAGDTSVSNALQTAQTGLQSQITSISPRTAVVAVAAIVSGGSITSAAGFGAASVVRGAAGVYTVTFSSAFPDTLYTAVASSNSTNARYCSVSRSTGACAVRTFNTSAVATDSNFSLVVFNV